MESTFGRFWKYENSTINLIPVDENEPRLGGKVQVRSFVIDFRTLTAGSKHNTVFIQTASLLMELSIKVLTLLTTKKFFSKLLKMKEAT